MNQQELIFSNIFKDFAILPGGSDICPSLYNKKNYKSHISNFTRQTDEAHISLYNKAVKRGQPIFGICRGLQLLSALNGLTLIQDLRHPSYHELTIRDLDTNEFRDKIQVNSIHHQLVYTNNQLEGENFKVYGYCKLSPYYDYQENETIKVDFEPEIIVFPKIRAIGVQFHPEMMDNNYEDTLNYLEQLKNLICVE